MELRLIHCDGQTPKDSAISAEDDVGGQEIFWKKTVAETGSQ